MIKVNNCPICGSKNIYSSIDLGIEENEELGIVRNENLTGNFDWIDVVISMQCVDNHIFYIPIV